MSAECQASISLIQLNPFVCALDTPSCFLKDFSLSQVLTFILSSPLHWGFLLGVSLPHLKNKAKQKKPLSLLFSLSPS